MAQGTMAWILENATKRVRHFRHLDGSVAVAADGTEVNFYAGNRSWTEVQVVPVDAEVAILPTLERQGDYVVQPGTKFRVLADWADRTPRLDEEGLDDREAYHLRMAAVVRLTRKEREHPPVDEEQVDAIAKALGEAQQNRPFPQQLSDRELREEAHLLVRQGVRVEAKS